MSQTKSGECGQHERCRVRTFRRTRTSDVSTSDVELVGRNKDVEPVITKEIADQIFGAFINESLKISPNFYGNGRGALDCGFKAIYSTEGPPPAPLLTTRRCASRMAEE
ncbi:hypothetical protein AX774_g4387 [Zancudomyces culisetae]|uniref:Uncharacterized protein n=1 Tax=Zancudomyces culisetae TaxID=1213189 RepID=A0A1R1PMI1_ZANCU|nr:hypothetical protein AX774_g4387 [Zancudomyces culisetae]|eukprot:OMH82143.1 hypothetical protein AX774_g4387 [Zancudomyces culisetae]